MCDEYWLCSAHVKWRDSPSVSSQSVSRHLGSSIFICSPRAATHTHTHSRRESRRALCIQHTHKHHIIYIYIYTRRPPPYWTATASRSTFLFSVVCIFACFVFVNIQRHFGCCCCVISRCLPPTGAPPLHAARFAKCRHSGRERKSCPLGRCAYSPTHTHTHTQTLTARGETWSEYKERDWTPGKGANTRVIIHAHTHTLPLSLSFPRISGKHINNYNYSYYLIPKVETNNSKKKIKKRRDARVFLQRAQKRKTKH